MVQHRVGSAREDEARLTTRLEQWQQHCGVARLGEQSLARRGHGYVRATRPHVFERQDTCGGREARPRRRRTRPRRGGSRDELAPAPGYFFFPPLILASTSRLDSTSSSSPSTVTSVPPYLE